MENNHLRLPFIPLRGITIFPNMVVSFAVGRQKSLDALERATEEEAPIFLVTQKNSTVSNPEKDDLCDIGTVAKVKQILKLPGNLTHVIVEGVTRGRLNYLDTNNDFEYAEIVEINQDNDEKPDMQVEALMRAAEEYYDEYAKSVSKISSNENIVNIISAVKPGQMADVIASGINISQESRQEILEILNPVERLAHVMKILTHELDIARLKSEIEEKVRRQVDKSQREYYLREEMKVIQEELGDKDGVGAEAAEFRKKLNEIVLPEQSREVIEREISRFERISQSSPDSNVLRSYLELVLSLPWGRVSNEKLDIKRAEKVLNADHYGLDKVKERIVEHLAVMKNAPNSNTPILCLAGPPGVGKTSIAKSLAKATGRDYVRMSLGGLKDESEIRGHRKTYIGAMPGRIIKSIKQAGVDNPLILLDEIDKLSSSYNGDPASALLEVLDSEQNYSFTDNYMEIPYDLSKVLFVCTANSLETIPAPLRDRMEIIELSSYTSEEKKNIASKHLYQNQLKKHNLTKSQLKIREKAFDRIISEYTREAGVRQLDRLIGKLCRKATRAIASGDEESVTVNEKNLEKFLGKKLVSKNKIYPEPQAGIVRGLAWTPFGGETLSVEVNVMAGSGKLELTGSMGDVMKESAAAAMSYIRSESARLNLEKDFYKKKDIHIHIPEGAVPKDGPSAGITMATAMISALTDSRVRNDVAMTGEITIRGRVLPIGGLKEKVIAAKKAGVVKIILPSDNIADMDEIPESIKNGMEFTYAKTMETVLDNAILEGELIWK